VDLALQEDAGSGDITSAAIFPADHVSRTGIIARENLIVCGLELARLVFERVNPDINVTLLASDGELSENGVTLLQALGPTVSLLTAERTVLNFLQHLSGIATQSRKFADLAVQAGTGVQIVDTRKTTPGWRELEKYAVRCGGCSNHRFSLGDQVLIKDNHISAAGSVQEAVNRTRNSAPHGAKIEVEAESPQQVADALEAGAEIIMLDNMSPAEIKEMLVLIDGAATVEVSGGISLATLADYALPGVDMISVGALTHSAPAVDISMSVTPAPAD